jgi:hypothetical protein
LAKAVADFLFGIFMGMGFACAQALLKFIVAILSGGIHQG